MSFQFDTVDIYVAEMLLSIVGTFLLIAFGLVLVYGVDTADADVVGICHELTLSELHTHFARISVFFLY